MPTFATSPTTQHGARDKTWRKLVGLTLEQLSERSGINIAQLSLHENDLESLTAERQQLVERILRVEMSKRRHEINQALGSVPSDRREKVREAVAV
jgi:transcriptional regulator with XRE-family HTH domain